MTKSFYLNFKRKSFLSFFLKCFKHKICFLTLNKFLFLILCKKTQFFKVFFVLIFYCCFVPIVLGSQRNWMSSAFSFSFSGPFQINKTNLFQNSTHKIVRKINLILNFKILLVYFLQNLANPFVNLFVNCNFLYSQLGLHHLKRICPEI